MNQSNANRLATEGHFDSLMGYGWASDATAWETICSKAGWSVLHAEATLVLIASMEKAGVADLPRAGSFMRAAARIAHGTLRDRQVALSFKATHSRR